MGKAAGTTTPIPGPNSIAEVQFLKLGGAEQWVLIRGRDAYANPALIMLHGGPGISETPFWRYFNSEALEGAYTVVYWDQRGSGKSYDPEISKETMTVNWFISDLDELVDAVCQKLEKEKVILFGHSWGSVLGPLYASRFPEKVLAYIGCAQLGDWERSEKMTYDYALSETERRGWWRAARDLRRIGEPPHNGEGLCTQRKWLADLEGDTDLKGAWQMLKIHYSVPEASIWDLFSFWTVIGFSIDAMWAEVTKINLLASVPELKMPTFFILGRRDKCVHPEISSDFVNALKAPSKEVVWFEESKHMPFMDEPEKFNEIMVGVVRQAMGTTSS